MPPLGAGEQIVLHVNGYNSVRKLSNREHVRPVKIGERVFSPKNPEFRTPEVWTGPTGMTVECSQVRCRAPPVLKVDDPYMKFAENRGDDTSPLDTFNRRPTHPVVTASCFRPALGGKGGDRWIMAGAARSTGDADFYLSLPTVALGPSVTDQANCLSQNLPARRYPIPA